MRPWIIILTYVIYNEDRRTKKHSVKYICVFGFERAEGEKTKSARERERAEETLENYVSRAGASGTILMVS